VAESLDKQIKRLEKKLKDIAEKEIPKAVARALNKVGKPTATEVGRKVSAQEKLPVRTVAKQMYFNPATAKTMTASVKSYTRGINVIRLLSKGVLAKKMGTGTNKRGVDVRGRSYPGAFINRTKKSGQALVFSRIGLGRTPLRVERIDIKKHLVEYQMPTLKARHLARFAKEYQHELSYRLSKYVR
jgi:thymidine phosphorylase